MTNERLQQIYDMTFSMMLEHNALTLPLRIGELCDSLGIQLCPLSSITLSTGLAREKIFEIWGNEDGAVTQYNGKNKIAYNDQLSRGRIRFTICEEIAHVILKHVEDSRFNIFKQHYDETTYQKYEEEARTSAGLMLCQPQYFYLNKEHFTPQIMSYLCDITEVCAVVRCGVLSRFNASIQANPTFQLLPQPVLYKKINIS